MYIQAPILSNSKPIENTGGRSSQLEKFGCCKANAANERGHNMPLNGQFRETFTLQHSLSLSLFPSRTRRGNGCRHAIVGGKCFEYRSVQKISLAWQCYFVLCGYTVIISYIL